MCTAKVTRVKEGKRGEMEYLKLHGTWTPDEADATPLSEEDAKVFKRRLQKMQDGFEYDYTSSDN